MAALFEGMKPKRSIGLRSKRRGLHASSARRSALRRSIVWVLMFVGMSLPLACGGNSASLKAPGAVPAHKSASMSTVPEAAAAFDRAEQDLQAQLLSGSYQQPYYPGPPQPQPTQPRSYNPSLNPQAPPGPSPTMNTGGDDRAAELAGDRCTNACRALASMKRSADRLCELAGDDNDRCINVRQRVESAAHLVVSMCPECKA